MQKFLLVIFGLANAGPALAFELPSCDNKAVLQKVRFQNGEAIPGPDGPPKHIVGAREISRGSPPPAVNQYATQTTFVTESRFCEARIIFENGSEDVVYWRVDQLTEEGKVTSRVESCTARGDPFKDGCEFWRPVKKVTDGANAAQCGVFFQGNSSGGLNDDAEKIAGMTHELSAARDCEIKKDKPKACEHIRRLVALLSGSNPKFPDETGVDVPAVMIEYGCN